MLAFHVPETNVPTDVSEELTTDDPNVVDDNTIELPILNVLPSERLTGLLNDHPMPAFQTIVLSVEPLRVIPPPSAVISVGVSTEPISMFLSSTVRLTVLIVVIVPLMYMSPATSRFPPINTDFPKPAPPVTTKAPEEILLASVAEVTIVSDENVLLPENVCEPVETNPVVDVPAIGMLRV